MDRTSPYRWACASGTSAAISWTDVGIVGGARVESSRDDRVDRVGQRGEQRQVERGATSHQLARTCAARSTRRAAAACSTVVP